tara:strand:+ start:11181 stop:12209 length:1029 start_codon:yes stop_codon:yes gene_type:complete
MNKFNFLFNFAVTTTGGGLKRLYAYSEWFNGNGGALFIIHPKCNFLKKKFPNNKYFIVFQSHFERVFNDCKYLIKIKKEINKPDLYYSYGIPIYYNFGKINWLHISNILPFKSARMGLTFFDKFIRLALLGWKMRKNFKNSDIISAESKNSLNIIKCRDIKKLFLSLNGSDDELNYLQNKFTVDKDNIAVIIGTQKYKALFDAYKIYKILKKNNNFLKLIIVGDKNTIPKYFNNNNNVILKGIINQNEVIELLKKTKYYISTTKIENSFNSAAEGIIFADESYISDIGPHRELLENEKYDVLTIPDLSNKVLKVQREDVKGKNLKFWSDIIIELVEKANIHV